MALGVVERETARDVDRGPRHRLILRRMGVPLRHDCTGHRRWGGGAARGAVHHAGPSRPLSAVPGAAFDRAVAPVAEGVGGGVARRVRRRAASSGHVVRVGVHRRAPGHADVAVGAALDHVPGRRPAPASAQAAHEHLHTTVGGGAAAVRGGAGGGSPRPSLGTRRVRAGVRAGLPVAGHRDRRADRHPRARPGAVPRLEPRHPRGGRGGGTRAGGHGGGQPGDARQRGVPA